MTRFGRICYGVFMVSLAVGLILALVLMWGDIASPSMWKWVWKALDTAIACFLASGFALAISREVLKQPRQKAQEDKQRPANRLAGTDP